MKKQFTKIWVLTGILLLSISTLAMFIPNAVAQDASSITVNAEVQDGCTWSGTPYESNLDVYDDEICIIRGDHSAGLIGSVVVHEDGPSGGGIAGGQLGGKLIIGGNSITTNVLVNSDLINNGTVEVGVTGNPSFNTTLTVEDPVDISTVGNDGNLTVLSNTNGNNVIDFNSDLGIGSLTTTGSFVLNDDSTTNQITNVVAVYGSFNVANEDAELEIVTSFNAVGSGTFNNKGTITVTNGAFQIRENSTGTNTGTINILDNDNSGDNFRLGASSENPTFNNTYVGVTQPGIINHEIGSYNPVTQDVSDVKWMEVQGEFNNTGTVNANCVVVMGNADFENNSGGTLNADAASNGGLFVVYDDDTDSTVVTFNNNDGAIVNTDTMWVVNGTYTDTTKVVFNNNYGAGLNADSISLGLEDAGFAIFGAPTFFGGILNNYADDLGSAGVIIDGTAGLQIYRGGKYNNLTGTTGGRTQITNGSVTIGTTTGSDGSCLSASDNDNCKITNNSTSGNAFQINGQLEMYGYSRLENEGIFIVEGTNDIVIHEDNVEITNGTNGSIGLFGSSQIFENDVTIDNDGTISSVSVTTLEFNDTASLDNAIGSSFQFSASGVDLTMNNSATITHGGDMDINDDIIINDDASLTMIDATDTATINATDLLLYDPTPTTPYFTMTDGTTTLTGVTRVYEGSTANINGGNFTTLAIYLGNISTNEDGGEFYIDNDGTVSSTSTFNYILIYRAIFEIKSTSTAAVPFTYNNRFHVYGVAAEQAIFNNFGAGRVEANNDIYLYYYGEVNIGDGVSGHTSTWDNNERNFRIFADSAGLNPGVLTIGTNGDFLDVNTLEVGAYDYSGYGGGGNQPGGNVVNYGSMRTTGSYDYYRLRRGGRFENYGSIYLGGSGYLEMEANTGVARPNYMLNDTGATYSANDFHMYYPDQILDNNGSIKTYNQFELGRDSSSYDGGRVNNYGSMEIGNYLWIRRGGQFHNYDDGVVSGITSGNLNYDSQRQALKYDNVTVTFPSNFVQNVTGQTSGATATISGWYNTSTNGVLLLTSISGTFIDGETIQGSAWGTATADGTLITNENFQVGDTITGFASGDTGEIVSDIDNGSSGTLSLKNIVGTFNNNEPILGTTQGSALANGTASVNTMNYVSIGGTNASATLEAAYYIHEGTDAPSQVAKLITDQVSVQSNGNFYSYDKVLTGNLNVGPGGNVELKVGTDNTQISSMEANGGTIQGEVLVERDPDEDAILESSNSMFVNVGGKITINGTLNLTGSSGALRVYNLSEAWSGPDSTFYMENANALGISLESGNPFVEIEGTVTGPGAKVNANYNNLAGGYLCFGEYTGVIPPGVGTCASSGNPINLATGFSAKNLGGTGTTVVDVANDMTVQGNITVETTGPTTAWDTQFNQLSTSVIEVQNGAFIQATGNAEINSDGEINITGTGGSNTGYIWASNGGDINLNYTSADYDIGSVLLNSASAGGGNTTITLGTGATLNLDDYEGSCAASPTNECPIKINENTASNYDPSIFNVNGTVNIDGTNHALQLGSSSATGGIGKLNIGATGAVNMTNNTNGQILIDDSGNLTIADGGSLTSDGPMDVQGLYAGVGEERGAYIGGTCTVDTSLNIEATGTMDVGLNGTMTVTGSTTSVYGNVELDGTLNPGDLTIYSGGVISSGDGNPTTTGTGCGVGGNFGCGTTTNFFIDADSVDVQSGGLIASDGVSNYQLGGAASSAEGGTYAGEGISNSSSTYGTAKAGGSTANHSSAGSYTTTYGDSGDWSGGYSEGGGAVWIRSTGDITINGEVRANGYTNNTASQATGSGGTVIIEQDIDHTDTTNVFDGSGYIRANGGNSSGAGNEVGGGGRIVIESILLDYPGSSSTEYDFDLSHIEALGGTNSNDSEYAAAGTMAFLGDDNNPNGTLLADQGENGPSASKLTDIPSTETFARIEAKDGADINYSSDPSAPTVCYTTGTGSSVTFSALSCDDYDKVPDKPDTFFINDTYEGAQTRAETPSDGEPAHDNQTVGIYDLTPVFTFIARNPELTTYDYDTLEIQVDDTDQTFSSLVWDATGVNAIDLGTDVVNDGDRTIDIEYAGTALSTATPYFVRARFVNTDGDEGLWTHMDMGNYYQFDIDGNLTIADGCSGLMQLENGGNNPSTASGSRYATDSCTFTITSTEAAFRLLFGLDPNSNGLENAGATADIDDIDNSGTTDCNITTAGTGTEEEWGFNISSLAALITNNINSNTDCTADYDDWTSGTGNYVFSVKANPNEDEFATISSGGVTAGTDFDVNIHATVNATTAADDYSADVRAIITTNP